MPILARHPRLRAGLSLVAALVVIRPPLVAQGQATSFDQLSVLVRPGDKVTVTPTTGSPFSGRIASLSSSELKVRVGNELRDLRELDVATVRQRRPDSLRNGALWGLGIGAGTGMLACGRCHVGPGLVVAGLYGGIGAGIGVGIDALIEGRLVVYQRRASTTRITVTPQLARSHKGVNVSLQF